MLLVRIIQKSPEYAGICNLVLSLNDYEDKEVLQCFKLLKMYDRNGNRTEERKMNT